MDLGALADQIEIPQRWEDAITWNLAKKLLTVTPEADMSIASIVQEEASASAYLAWGEDRDKSNIIITANFGAYTR